MTRAGGEHGAPSGGAETTCTGHGGMGVRVVCTGEVGLYGADEDDDEKRADRDTTQKARLVPRHRRHVGRLARGDEAVVLRERPRRVVRSGGAGGLVLVAIAGW